MNTPIMTLDEVADFLQVHASTVRTLTRNQGLPYFKIGTDFRVHRDAVWRWVADQEKQAQTEYAAQWQRRLKRPRKS